MKKVAAFLLVFMMLLPTCLPSAAENLSVIWLSDGMEVHSLTLTAALGSEDPMELIPVSAAVGSERLCGYVNTAGEVVIEPQYASAYPFADGLARVAVKNAEGKTKYGVINTRGEFVTQPQYDNISAFSDGTAIVTCTGDEGTMLYGYINTAGEEIIAPQYATAFQFLDGYAKVGRQDENGVWLFGMIDKKNRTVIEMKYVSLGHFSEGLVYAALPINGEVLYGFLNEQGEIVFDFKYSSAGDFSEGLASVGVHMKNAKPRCGYINTAGEMVIEPRYAHAGPFVNGFAVATQFTESENFVNYGLINSTGKYVVQPRFSSVHSVVEGTAVFALRSDSRGWELNGWYNVETNSCTNLDYNAMGNFSSGLACVAKDKAFVGRKYGFVIPAGGVVVPLKYDAATSFVEGLGVVGRKNSDGKLLYGCIDTSCEFVLPMEYDSITVVANIVSVKKDGRSGFAINPGFGMEHTYTGPAPWNYTARETAAMVLTALMVVSYIAIVIRDIGRKKKQEEPAPASENNE